MYLFYGIVKAILVFKLSGALEDGLDRLWLIDSGGYVLENYYSHWDFNFAVNYIIFGDVNCSLSQETEIMCCLFDF